MQAPFQLASFIVEPHRHRLLKDEESISVEPLVMRVLLRLAQNAGAIVTREDLMASVWPDGVASDASLSRAIWGLRRVLGDQTGSPRYIETIPRVGYRLIPHVTPIATQTPIPNTSAQPTWLELPTRPSGGGATSTLPLVPLPTTASQASVSLRTLQRTIMRLKATVAVLSLLVVALMVAVFAGQREHSEYVQMLKFKDASGRVDSIIVHSESPIDLSTTFKPRPPIP